MGKGGEIFVLDMGQPVRIVELARKLIILSGLQPDRDIRVEFTGIRPGEKLYEELSAYQENTLPTYHEKIKSPPETEDRETAWNPTLTIEAQRQAVASMCGSIGPNKTAWNGMVEWHQSGGHWVPNGRPP